jgi:MFS transporter, ACS family, hexuronate transporter
MGIVWLILWLLLYELPERHRCITAEELALIQEGAAATGPATRVNWLQLWTRRDIWGILIARFFGDPVWWFYLFWMPKYLVENRGFTMTELGLFAWLPYLTSDIGSILGGYASGKLIARGWPAVKARYAAMLPAVMFMPASIAISFVHSSAAALALICAITFCHMIWKTNVMTLVNDLYPVSWVGSAAGIVSLGGGLGGVLFMNLTGRMVDALSYGTIFFVMGFLHPAAYLVCRLMIPGTPATINAPVERSLPEYAPPRK